MALNTVDSEGKGMFSFQMYVDLLYLFRAPPLTEVELKETFDLMDRDKSGTVDAFELKQIMMCLGHGLSIEESEQLIELADKDGNNEIDFEEFAHVIMGSQV